MIVVVFFYQPADLKCLCKINHPIYSCQFTTLFFKFLSLSLYVPLTALMSIVQYITCRQHAHCTFIISLIAKDFSVLHGYGNIQHTLGIFILVDGAQSIIDIDRTLSPSLPLHKDQLLLHFVRVHLITHTNVLKLQHLLL